jgi:uncharacterized small protein (DUF1192 family)
MTDAELEERIAELERKVERLTQGLADRIPVADVSSETIRDC